VTLESVMQGKAQELGDFVEGSYEARLRRNPDRVQAQLTREGQVGAHRIRITKGVTLDAERSQLEITYLLENLPANETLHFATELNFAGLPSGADDRYYFQGSHRLGQLGSQLEIQPTQELGLADEWLGLALQMNFNQPTAFWTYPVETVSQSEGGFELVHQSVVVLPHWKVRGDEQGRWSVTWWLDVDTRMAESRMESSAAAAH
jgi:alpha-amylase